MGQKISKDTRGPNSSTIHLFLTSNKREIQDACTLSQKRAEARLNLIFMDLAPDLGISRIVIRVVDNQDRQENETIVVYGNMDVNSRTMKLDLDYNLFGSLKTFGGWNEFMDALEETMIHELRHQEDKDTGLLLPDAEYKELRDLGSYYDISDEMLAYSRQSISELRNHGMTDLDILNALDSNNEDELASHSNVFKTYLEFKDDDPDLYSDFVSLIEGHIKREFKMRYSKKSRLMRRRADAPKQEYDSAATSLDQVAAVFKKVSWQPDTVNLDYGGGRFDKATDFLKTKNVENLVYDPFNRSAEHNKAIKDKIAKEKADTGTLANVLNVIKEKDVRIHVLKDLKSMVKPGGEIYIAVYWDPKQQAKETSKGWQNHMPPSGYLDEINEVFGNSKVKNGIIYTKA